jgi:quinol monooxygenase YgiN
MLTKLVRYQVRRDAVDAARAATLKFADEVRRKEGATARFDVYQEAADPTRFVHVVAFRAAAGEKYHEGTAWRKAWLATVGPLCAEPPAAVEVEAL